jgi:3-hydroxyacyl-[acyl-carrier-protein] dehydratase
MAQTGVVAFGLYLHMRQMAMDHAKKLTTLFTLAEEVEFTGVVHPGERVIVKAQKIYFRMGNLKMKVTMERENGETVSFGVLAGKGVPYQS